MKAKQSLTGIIGSLLLAAIFSGEALAINDFSLATEKPVKSRDIDTDLLREKAKSYEIKGDIESSEKLKSAADAADRVQQLIDNVVQKHEQMSKEEFQEALDELGDENKRILEIGKEWEELRAKEIL